MLDLWIGDTTTTRPRPVTCVVPLLQPASLAFVGLTVLGVACQSLGGSVVTPPLDVVDRFGARLVDIAAGEAWRLLTAPFVSTRAGLTR